MHGSSFWIGKCSGFELKKMQNLESKILIYIAADVAGVAQVDKDFVDLYVAQPLENLFEMLTCLNTFFHCPSCFENIPGAPEAARVTGTTLFIVDR